MLFRSATRASRSKRLPSVWPKGKQADQEGGSSRTARRKTTRSRRQMASRLRRLPGRDSNTGRRAIGQIPIGKRLFRAYSSLHRSAAGPGQASCREGTEGDKPPRPASARGTKTQTGRASCMKRPARRVFTGIARCPFFLALSSHPPGTQTLHSPLTDRPHARSAHRLLRLAAGGAD